MNLSICLCVCLAVVLLACRREIVSAVHGLILRLWGVPAPATGSQRTKVSRRRDNITGLAR